MTPPRIADRDLAATIDPASAARRSSAGERFGAAIASPVGVMIVVPGLVAAVGLFLTVIGQNCPQPALPGYSRKGVYQRRKMSVKLSVPSNRVRIVSNVRLLTP